MLFVRIMSQEFCVKLFPFHILTTEETRNFVNVHFMSDWADASTESANNYILILFKFFFLFTVPCNLPGSCVQFNYST